VKNRKQDARPSSWNIVLSFLPGIDEVSRTTLGERDDSFLLVSHGEALVPVSAQEVSTLGRRTPALPHPAKSYLGFPCDRFSDLSDRFFHEAILSRKFCGPMLFYLDFVAFWSFVHCMKRTLLFGVVPTLN
jgi:hypothetical protein